MTKHTTETSTGAEPAGLLLRLVWPTAAWLFGPRSTGEPLQLPQDPQERLTFQRRVCWVFLALACGVVGSATLCAYKMVGHIAHASPAPLPSVATTALTLLLAFVAVPCAFYVFQLPEAFARLYERPFASHMRIRFWKGAKPFQRSLHVRPTSVREDLGLPDRAARDTRGEGQATDSSANDSSKP